MDDSCVEKFAAYTDALHLQPVSLVLRTLYLSLNIKVRGMHGYTCTPTRGLCIRTAPDVSPLKSGAQMSARFDPAGSTRHDGDTEPTNRRQTVRVYESQSLPSTQHTYLVDICLYRWSLVGRWDHITATQHSHTRDTRPARSRACLVGVTFNA